MGFYLFQDIDDIEIHYPGILEVMTDLQGTNSLVSMATCWKKWRLGVTGSGVYLQGWERATVRGTGERCCTETASWLQRPSTKVELPVLWPKG